MTISIKVNDDGKVQNIYHGERSGDEWITVADSDVPAVNEDNVSKTYWWDGKTLTVETENIPTDDGIV